MPLNNYKKMPILPTAQLLLDNEKVQNQSKQKNNYPVVLNKKEKSIKLFQLTQNKRSDSKYRTLPLRIS